MSSDGIGERNPVLELNGVSHVYATESGKMVKAVKDFNVTVRDGEFVSLIGPSGCGKSTIVQILSGLMRPSRGAVRLLGKDLTGQSSHVGVVFQKANLLPWCTVASNVATPLRLQKAPRKESRQRALELLETVQMEKFADHYPAELSGGMQQRVAIARALSAEPELLLMDEPFGALDAITRELMSSELLRIWERTGCTVLFITHSISEAVFLADRVLVMSSRPGTVQAETRVQLPRPRTMDVMADPYFGEVTQRLRSELEAPLTAGN